MTNRLVLVIVLVAVAVGSAGAAELSTGPALPTAMGGDGPTFSVRGSGGKACWGGAPTAMVTTEGSAVVVVFGVFPQSCGTVSPTACADAFCADAQSFADAMCRGNRVCDGECASDQRLTPINDDCLVECLSVTVSGMCQREGPSDPFRSAK